MSKPIERICKLVDSLPKNDIELGKVFIKERKFESLLDLVNSDIYLVKKNLKSDNPKEEYNIDLDTLITLQAEVNLYLSQLDIGSYDSDYNDFEDEEIEEEFY